MKNICMHIHTLNKINFISLCMYQKNILKKAARMFSTF